MKKKSVLRLLVLIGAVVALGVIYTSAVTHAQVGFTGAAAPTSTFTVNSIADPGSGSCDATECTLREAMLAANANPGADIIAFNIPGVGVHTIQPLSALPTITGTVTIDGYSQPGASPNTLAVGNDAVLLIELNGQTAGPTGVDGLKITAGSSTIRGLVIGRFSNAGISIETSTGISNTIAGNFIGTNPAGTASRGNGVYGVITFNNNGGGNTIGGTTPATRNLISGNTGPGIALGSGNGNIIQGNYIGTDKNGVTDLGNNPTGILVGTSNNVIGGTSADARNLISSSSSAGIRIGGNSRFNLIQGNYIGTTIAGTAALPNGGGVLISGSGGYLPTDNTIGGTAPGAGNLISGNSQEGIELDGATVMSTTIQGNYIGVNANGTAALNNGSDGVRITSAINNTIGGTTTGARNLISGNSGVGIRISGSTNAGYNNVVQGNYIGTGINGTEQLGNGQGGVLLTSAFQNTIGGATSGAGNKIAFNTSDGVNISNSLSTGNRISSNSIFSNAQLGIDLEPNGVTPNDPGDGDTGPNDLQNYPLLTAAASSGGTTVITGTLNSSPSTPFAVQFFSNSVCDASGSGEGETYIGSVQFTTDGSGNASFTATLVATVPPGYFITSTATDRNTDDTSEFSACVQIPGGATATPTVTSTSTATSTAVATATSTSTSTPTNTQTATNTATSIVTSTPTSTAVATNTGTSTSTSTPVPTSTNTSVPTSINTAVPSATQTGTSLPTSTQTNTVLPTGTNTTTVTNTPLAPTPTATGTPTSVATSTATNTTTLPTNTSTSTATATLAPPTGTSTIAATSTATATASATNTQPAPTNTETAIATSTATASSTSTPVTPTTEASATPTIQGTAGTIATATVAASATSIATGTLEATATPITSATPTHTAISTATATSTACPLRFNDVLLGSTFYEYIQCLACRGVISGYQCGGPGEPCDPPNPYFRPYNNITRAQIAKVISNAAGFSEGAGEQIFDDVPPDYPFYVYINRLAHRGIMDGYPCPSGDTCQPTGDRYFRPEADSTRGQLAKIVSNAAGFQEPVSGQTYTDVLPSNTFYVFIERLTSRGAMSGYMCGTNPNELCDEERRSYFRPYNTVTRGQSSKIVSNTFFPDCQAPAMK